MWNISKKWFTEVSQWKVLLLFCLTENRDSDKWLSQRHTAEKWQSQCFNPSVSAFRAYILEGEIKVILLIEDWPYVMTSVYGWFHNNPTKIELIPQFQSWENWNSDSLNYVTRFTVLYFHLGK